MSQTVDRAIQSLTEAYAVYVEDRYARYKSVLARPPESPIEEALLVALIGLDTVIPVFRFEGDGTKRPPRDITLFVRPQLEVGRYRVDFVLEIEAEGVEGIRIAIECDGFEFHDRTKELAARDKARDRELVALGYRVMRFTGSEIFRDATDCAHQVLHAAVSLAKEKGWKPSQ